MWDQLKLKSDEAHFFYSQMAAHTRYPKQFLFYLSAFLSSTRSITFHLQKQFAHIDKDNIYNSIRMSLLDNNESRYFVNARNYVEKEGYPHLEATLLVGRHGADLDGIQWEHNARSYIKWEPQFSGLEFLENIQKREWESTSIGGPANIIKYKWAFYDFPDGPKDVIMACGDQWNRIWELLVRFREHLEVRY